MGTRPRRFRSVIGAIVVVTAIVPLAVAVKRTTVHAEVGARVRPDRPEETSTDRPADTAFRAIPAPLAVTQSTTTPARPPAIEHGGPYAKHPVIEYDKRSFDQMGEAWLKETDDPEWSLNVKTFVGAMVETAGRPDAQSLDAVSVRCKQTVCRLDVEAADVVTFADVLQSSSQQQRHVTYYLSNSDAGAQIEAYLGRERGAPTDQP